MLLWTALTLTWAACIRLPTEGGRQAESIPSRAGSSLVASLQRRTRMDKRNTLVRIASARTPAKVEVHFSDAADRALGPIEEWSSLYSRLQDWASHTQAIHSVHVSRVGPRRADNHRHVQLESFDYSGSPLNTHSFNLHHPPPPAVRIREPLAQAQAQGSH
ncbi:hypothetical protein CBOM_00619 [Ceraceosorus bombacis]|uniref:Secreted protein n=1 Tax=Ceraceosorus bombacis TaxID=401625 RepID=A0A0P1BA97_9BASI|nr:hypothetical protein CBOM_00619 [Ceraceosorus bombacis]